MKRKCNDHPSQSQIQRSLPFEEEIFSVYKATVTPTDSTHLYKCLSTSRNRTPIKHILKLAIF